MANKGMKKYVRKIGKASKWSYNVVIPKEIIAKYNWREKQKITIVDKGRGKLEIYDWPTR
ncbi:MAG: AbrB/MazE/SpoVT family DNA-binding domain-containing protein [Patescibacteria group bacterium]|jgi:bifunctional DNA-binding transcriptional regulator/antitoxin component of YhaV-PrlF toxin-antitoxin module